MGFCNCNRPYQRNFQTTINLNYGPTYNQLDYKDFNFSSYTNNLKAYSDNNEEKYIIPMYNDKLFNMNSYFNNEITYNINSNIEDLNTKYNTLKEQTKIFYDNVNEQEKLIENYKSIITKEKNEINNLKKSSEMNGDFEKNQPLTNMENISNKINKYNDLIENQKDELKNIEKIFKKIQDQLDIIKKNEQNYPNIQDFFLFLCINNIKQQLLLSETIIKKLETNQKLFEENRNELEKDIKNINKEKENLKKIQKEKNVINHAKTTINKVIKNNKINNKKVNNSLSIKNTMLLSIKDLNEAKFILNSKNLFIPDEAEEDNYYEEPNIKSKNWHETCYINDDYDLHEVTYKLRAIGFPDDINCIYTSFNFNSDSQIDIVLFEIDGIKSQYEYSNYFLKFIININKFQPNNIRMIYKESPLYNKMTEGEKKLRKIYREKKYGLSKVLSGQRAKFILINKSNLEIINFEDEFFIQVGDNEYQWGGIVPLHGKETKIKLSKKEGLVNFYEKHVLKTTDNTFITNTVTKIPFCYLDGNNQMIKIKYGSKQTKKIRIEKYRKEFIVRYNKIKGPMGEFEVRGKLKNKCQGEWNVNLKDDEIESLIPPDFETNKEEFKKIAKEIIKTYDEEHKDDLVLIPNVAKIGKWIKKNIVYDLRYKNFKDLTAMDVYKLRRGVCHHLTKLFNAIMYSLGYQVLYVLGYVVDKKNTFTIEDVHAWSLIKIDGKWLPFDATWGIFSGKLPVTHIFKQIDSREIKTMSCDNVKIEPIFVEVEIS